MYNFYVTLQVTGLPGESSTEGFGYGQLKEEADTEHGYLTIQPHTTPPESGQGQDNSAMEI